MIWQICLDYNCLPPIREITLVEIFFFYQGSLENWKKMKKVK